MQSKLRNKIGIIGSRSGFSLVELIVVCAILGILAAAALVSINTADSELKAFVFTTKAKFRQVRFDAIKRGRNVFIDFDFDNDGAVNSDGYTIWADNNGDNFFNAGDDLVETVDFTEMGGGGEGPEVFNPATVAGGPAVGNGPGGANIGIGVTADRNGPAALPNPDCKFRFRPTGDSNAGSVYLYYPQGPVGARALNKGPWAIIVAPTGRIRVDRWNHVTAGNWDVD